MKHARLAVAVSLLLLGLSGASWAQDQSLPYYQAGNTFYSQKNYDQAIRYYRAAAQMNPQLWQAYQGEGNCYYAKGDKASALTNYQKALAINPNNPQLSSFTQALQAQVGAAPGQPTNSAVSPGAPASSSPKAMGPPKMFELAPFIGVGVAGTLAYPATQSGSYSQPATAYDAGLGLGLGAGGYYLVDKNLGIGLILDYFMYSKGASQPVTTSNSSFQPTVATETSSNNINLIEILPSVKYTLDGNSIRPYFIGSLGFCLASTSSSVNFGSWSNGSPIVPIPNGSATGPSYSGPMAQLGVGGEYPMGDAMNLFLQVKYSLVFTGNTTFQGFQYMGFTFSSIPIEAGASFDF